MREVVLMPLRMGLMFVSALILSLTFHRADAAEVVTVDIHTQALNLDDGTVSNSAGNPASASTGADVMFAYNADRTCHVVAFPAEEGVEIAFFDNIGFDGVSAVDLEGLSFSAEPPDLPLEAVDTIVVRTDTGAIYKLGNAVESADTVTLNYEIIQ